MALPLESPPTGVLATCAKRGNKRFCSTRRPHYWSKLVSARSRVRLPEACSMLPGRAEDTEISPELKPDPRFQQPCELLPADAVCCESASDEFSATDLKPNSAALVR